MNERLTRRLAIRGHVQGVWFRESMRLEAERLGVAGWVCNRFDGTVEAVVQGPVEAVEAIIRWTRRGPRDARVESVEIAAAEGEFSDFEKRPGY
jgi:acylphosphatase